MEKMGIKLHAAHIIGEGVRMVSAFNLTSNNKCGMSWTTFILMASDTSMVKGPCASVSEEIGGRSPCPVCLVPLCTLGSLARDLGQQTQPGGGL